ncbi:MAG TPA: type II toxin-antitoxin system HigB family toxin [Hyphomicrobiaceae bacterium]|nr:type II toxin-antitoxin system HigB family toxin [Hyphomicrobiaceae bacterium]
MNDISRARAGHKGINVARTQYAAWFNIATLAAWRNPQDVKAAYPRASILKSGRVVSNIRDNDFRLVARPTSSIADLIRHLMDQHGLTRADMAKILGPPSRVSEVLRGRKGLSMAMVEQLRARFHVPADLLLPPLSASRRHAA